MSIGQILAATDISASGLRAERMRMEVVANNIANIHATKTPSGGPFRRQEIVFTSAYNDALTQAPGDTLGLRGVQVSGIVEDKSEFPTIFDPTHPDADDRGFVALPNVKLPHEMIDLMVASRTYEANLKSLQTFRQMTEQTLSILRGNG